MTQKIILALWTLLAAWTLTSCGTTSPALPLSEPEPKPKPPIVNNPPAPGPRVGELNVETYECRWGGVVNGNEEVFANLILRNKSNKNVISVKVTVTFKNALGQEATQTFDFARNLIPDEVNFKGPNLVEARLKWANSKNLKSCQVKLENVVYAN
jgi:hypothetical protein